VAQSATAHTRTRAAQAAIRLPFSGLRLQLLILVLIAVVPTAGLGLYMSFSAEHKAASEVRQQTLDVVRLIATREHEQVTVIRELLSLLATTAAIGSAMGCDALANNLIAQSPYYANMGAATPNGDVYCSAVPLRGPVNVADRGWFKGAVAAQGFSAGDYQVGRITHKASQNFGYPIFDGSGKLQGVVYVALDLDWFAQVAASTHLAGGADFVVVDQHGGILTRYPDPDKWTGRTMPDTPLARAVGRGLSEGTVVGKAEDGVLRVYAYAPLGPTPESGGAYLALGIPTSVAFADANHELASTLILLLLTATAALAVALTGADRFILRGVNALLTATTRLSMGDLSARAGPRYVRGELGMLAGAFDEMAESLEIRAAEAAKAEEALRHSERRFRALIEHSSDGITLIDADRTIVYASPAVERMLGYAPEELVGQKIYKSHPDDQPRTADIYEHLLAEPGTRAARELRVRHRDGSWRRVEGVATNLLHDPSVRAIVGNFRDVTERRNAEEALQQNERRFRALIEQSSDVTVLTRPDGTISYASPSVTRVLGYSPEDMIGQRTLALLHPDDAVYVGELFAKLQREPGGQTSAEFRVRRKDGSWRWMEAVGMNLLANPDVQSIVSHFWDITARRDAEEAVRRRAADLEALHEIAQELRQARSLEEMYDTLVDRSMAVFEAVHGSLALLSADRSTFTRVSTKGVATEAAGSTFPAAGSRSGKVVASNVPFVTGDFATEVLPRPWMRPEAYQTLGPFALVSVRSEEDTLGTLVVARPRVPEGRPFTASDVRLLETIAETAGSAIRRAQLLADLQRHAAELERRVSERTADLRSAKEEADRANQAKSDFLSRMSHELRTPLNAVLGFAQVLEMDSLSAEQRESIAYIVRGGRHLLTLINEVLDIARIEAGGLGISLEPVALEPVMRETLDLMRPVAAETAASLTGGVGGGSERYVLADSGRLKQILLNLVGNAIKYGGRGVAVTLSCTDVPGGCVRIAVADTGPGIPADKVARLFTPFDRLGSEHTDIEGTGLGLALSKGLAEAMGGMLGVDTAPGRGSVFFVDLPAAQSPIEQLDADGATGTPGVAGPDAAHCSITVLYIEDNLSNFELVKRVLVQRPHVRLVPAMQGRLGLDLARRHRPEVILLDLHLPDIRGDEVLRRLGEMPETRAIPVIMISADATAGQPARLLAAGARAYLTKPLDVKPFLALIDQYIGTSEVRRASGQ